MVQQVRLTITTNNVEDLINDMKSAMVYITNTLHMLNGIVDEIEAAHRAGRVIELREEDVAKLKADAEETYRKAEASKKEALDKASTGSPVESIGLMPIPEGKARPAAPGEAVLPTDPRMRSGPGPQPSKKKNR